MQGRILALKLVNLLRALQNPTEDAVQEVWDTMNPFDFENDGNELGAENTIAFDPLKPLMSSIQRTLNEKLEMTFNIFVHDILKMLVHEAAGGDNVGTLMMFCKNIVNEYELSIEEWEVVPPAAIDMLLVCRCLMSLGEPGEEAYFDECKEMRLASVRAKKGSVGTAAFYITNNEWWGPALVEVLDKEADLKKYHGTLFQSQGAVQVLDVESTTCGASLLPMLAEVAKLRIVLRHGATGSLEQTLLTKIKAHGQWLKSLAHVLALVECDAAHMAALESLAMCIQESSKLWQWDETMNVLRTWCQESMQQHRWTAKVAKLKSSLAHADVEDPVGSGTALPLLPAIEAAAGCLAGDESQSVVDGLLTFAAKVLDGVLNRHEQTT